MPYILKLIEHTCKKKEFLKLYIIIQNHVLQPCPLPFGSSHFTDLWFALLFKQQRDWLCVRKCPIQNVVMYFFMGILTLQVTLFFCWNTFTLKFNSINWTNLRNLQLEEHRQNVCFFASWERKEAEKDIFTHGWVWVCGGLPDTWHWEFNCFCCHRPLADLSHSPDLHLNLFCFRI